MALDGTLVRRLEQLVEEGALEEVEGRPFAPLVVFESGSRLGLFLHDEGARWAVARGDVLAPFSEKGARAFVEALEIPRSEFEEQLARGAESQGFDVQATLLCFPAIELVTLILEARSAFLTRLALAWPLPSELRSLRDAIAAVVEDTTMPGPVRDFASRLVVPE